MNIATVFKQARTTSAARMSTSRIHHHRTELSMVSSSSSINFDNLKRNKISGQLPQQHQQQQQQQQQQKSCKTQTKSSVLMESNSVLNVVQELGNDHRHQHRKKSLSLTDERLLKILSAPPDEPLYIRDTTNNQTTLNGDINNSSYCDDNLLIQYERTAAVAATTSSIVAVDDYENLPPADKYTVANANIEDVETMTSTPQRGFGTIAWNKLQRDLNSPSASCRVRAIRAMNSPANDHYYNNFDATNDESIAEVERSIEMPRTIEEVMKDVIVYVEVRSGTENRTSGIKSAIANLGAKVNDRLLRNTSHVVFKDGLQSTYNKAKSWNIPIVSILWIEACKKHLILMDPKDYPISNVEKFENPDLYEKTKRQKCIQPDTLMKNLHRPIPKSKILESLKKTGTALSSSQSSSSTAIDKTMNALPNVTLARKTASFCVTTKPTTTSMIQARKSISRKLMVNPNPQKNTIRSMFQKQLEKSQTLECSQSNGDMTLNNEVTVNAQETVDQKADVEPTQKDEQILESATNAGTSLVTGSLHKRLTRRNSMSVQTPTKNTAPKMKANAEISSVLSSAKKNRRCTMFTPSKCSIDEDDETDRNSLNVVNKTVNKTVEMELCNGVPTNTATHKCNSKVRQILNKELLQKTPIIVKKPNGIANVFAAPDSSLRRRTTYTPQVMDETNVQSILSSTPVFKPSMTQRRKTMNVNAMSSTPRSTMIKTSPILDDLIETTSCDAVLTPTNKPITELGTAISTTPLIKSLSKTHIDNIHGSTSKTLLDEYNSTFNSKKTPMTNKRRTIANITMDIIKQRIENINRNASFNRSTTDFHDDSFQSNDIKATPTHVENAEKLTATATTSTPANGDSGQPKPLKRKLFAPPSLFPANSPQHFATPQKTDKKTATSTQKRKRNDLAARATAATSEEKMMPIDQPRASNKKPNARRSTLYFEEPIRKINCDASVPASTATASTASSSGLLQKEKPGLVYTSMHQSQIDFISEAVKKLGKFKLENKVTVNTTHLVSLDNRRTVNMLRGLIRGVWILTFEYIVESFNANKWLAESDYEFRTFSKAVEMNRIERQAFGRKYRTDLFRSLGSFYLAPNCACKNLKELVVLCYGKIEENESTAHFFITENYIDRKTDSKNLQVHPNWILDSITAGRIQPLKIYLLTL